MNIALFAYSRQGCVTAGRIGACFREAAIRAFTVERFAGDGIAPFPPDTGELYGELFRWADAMIFVGSCGIAVRKIAPYVRDKKTDPAVLCVDELGRFVISLLSGHIGGANALALLVAKQLNATPVITTATDINGKLSVDAWAARNGYAISSLHSAKAVSAGMLEKDVPLQSDFPIVTDLPKGLALNSSGDVGIRISIYREEPFETTLRLIPPVLHLGIGCRKGISAEQVREAVEEVLTNANIDRRAIRCAASIDLKEQEQGLLAFCEEWKLPVSFYTAEELKAVAGEFTPSEFVRSITGVDNVCERSALMGAEELVVRKTVRGGVTVALAAEHWEVRFD